MYLLRFVPLTIQPVLTYSKFIYKLYLDVHVVQDSFSDNMNGTMVHYLVLLFSSVIHSFPTHCG